MKMSDMVRSKLELHNTIHTQLKSDHCGKSKPTGVHGFDADPWQMGDSVRYHANRAAPIIDITSSISHQYKCTA